MNPAHALWLPLLAAVSTIPVATAQEASTPSAEIRIGKDGFVLPKGEIDITHLIDKAAEFLRWNIFYSETELAQGVSSPIRLQRELAVDARGCEEVLCELLYMRGFTLLEMDRSKNMFEVVFLSGARGHEVYARAQCRTPEEILRRPNFKSVVITDFQLQHNDALYVVNSLQPFLRANHSVGGGLAIGTAGNKTTLTISGFQFRVAAVLKLVMAADIPPIEQPAIEPSRIDKLERAIEELREQVRKLASAKKNADD